MPEYVGVSITILKSQKEWLDSQGWITNRSQFIRNLIEMARRGRPTIKEDIKHMESQPRASVDTDVEKKKKSARELNKQLEKSRLFRKQRAKLKG